MRRQVSRECNIPIPAAQRQRDIAKPQADGLPDMQDGTATAGDAMSEGKFKKRIRLFLTAHTPSGYLEDYGLHQVTDLDKMVDEAREEFPCYKCTLRCCMCGRECHEFKQWSIKWLGEST